MPAKKKPFQRKKPSRSPNPMTFVNCEGETERIYVKSLREYFKLETLEILPVTTETDALSIVERAISQKNQNEKDGMSREGDCFFSIFDGDNATSKATKHAKKNGIETIISSPCFEYWVLLHFKKTDRPYENCPQVTNDVKKHDQEYKKTDPSFYAKIIKEKLESAERNAQSNDKESSSYSDMHILVAHLRKMLREAGRSGND